MYRAKKGKRRQPILKLHPLRFGFEIDFTVNLHKTKAMTIESLKLEALKLERLQRIDFIAFLLESLAKEERELDEISLLSEAQQKEIERRIQAIKTGAVKTVPHTEVEANIRARYGF